MENASTLSVLFVNHTAQLGGGEVALLNLVSSLDPARIHVSVLLFADGPLRQLLVERHISVMVLELPDHILNARKGSLSVLSLLRLEVVMAGASFLFRLRRAIRDSRADLIHTNSLKADILAGIAARSVGIPVLWHVRDRIADDYLPVSAAKLFRWLARVVPQYLIVNSAATLATLLDSQGYGDHISAKELHFRSRCRVVHDGVPSIEAAPSTPSSRNHLEIGIVGRISPWKGQDVFLRAAELVHRHYRAVRFTIIGAPLFGEASYEAEVKALSQQLGIAKTVIFTGFLADIPTAIRKLDILVHASILPEPFGQVIIEGMAAGKPVVATDGGGVLEIVVHGVTGLLVPMRDPERMAGALLKLIESREMRVAMGEAGKKRVQDFFLIQHTAQKITSVYETLLTSKMPSAPGQDLAPAVGRLAS